ncbi:MerR family transcriptional regulator [Nocardia brevicatena]|uniref:MerR family transcriptional regulator n=1 Tax=Nocardia brevicatena TaxID=37327 RepID=UPI0003023F7A|nr:MerR family transcriptional regulator [Nocardia brevicatena]
MTSLDIAEVAEQAGLTPSALRFYEKRGLIEPNGRNGLRRTYHPDVLARLALVTCARSAGFTIAQIAGFLTATPQDAELRTHLVDRAKQLDEDIARLTRMRDGLRHTATCTHKPLVDCPEFQRILAGPEAETAHTSA